MALALQGFGGFVVQPDGGSEPAGRPGGDRYGVAGGVSEPGGDLAAARVQAGVSQQVGGGQRVFGVREPFQDPAVGGGGARNGLDLPELGVGEPEADGAHGAAAVGRFEHDQAAAGADQGGPGVQQFVEGIVERAGSGQPLGEFVQRGEVGDPKPASRSWMKAPGAEGTSVRDPAVCAETGTVGSIPATFGRCGALMASGFPTSAFCRIASQTPMSFCAAISASACTRSTTCTRTSEAMSSIVPTGFMVSGRPLSWPKNAPEGNYLRSTGRARTGGVLGVKSRRERHFGHAGYVIDEGQGQF